MPDRAILERLVRQVAREVRLRRAEYGALRGLFAGALVAAVPLLFRAALGELALVLAGAALLAGAVAGAAWYGLRRVSSGEAAQLADRAFGFQDRVATALECADASDRSPLADLVLADAVARAEAREPRRVVARRIPREAKLIPLPLALGVALAVSPPIPLPSATLPSFSVSAKDDEEAKAAERAGQLQVDERPKAAKRDTVARGEAQERTVTPRGGGGGPTAPGDLAAIFKDTSMGSRSPDFNSFLKKGDDRLRMLDQVDKLPDLKRDFTQSQYKVVFQRSKELRGGMRPDQVSPDKLRELLNEMERLGRKGGNNGNPWGGDVAEGMEALDQGQNDKAMEAMERALSKLRSMEERGRDGKGLRGGREDERRGGQRGKGQRGGQVPGEEGDWPEGEGSLPGRGKSASPKGDPTKRLSGNPFDVGVEGESRSGRKDGYDTNMLGKGGAMPSRMQYLGIVGQYRKMMEEAIAREQVPRDFQGQVKQYFQSLEERDR